MYISAQEANIELSKITTEAELRSLISSLDVSAAGKVTLLYGGDVGGNISSNSVISGMLANGDDIRVIDTTEAAKFLNIDVASSSQNTELANTLKRIFGDDPSVRGTSANQFLFGTKDSNGARLPNGAWDNVSGRFVDATVGEVRTLTGGAGADRVFAQTEVPRLLANSGITHVDGMTDQPFFDFAFLSVVAQAKKIEQVRIF